MIAQPSSTTLADYKLAVNQSVEQIDPNKAHFDFIIIGLGSMGSSACYHLAGSGHSVLGLEQFEITHENGSHAGQSRLIRQAYFEHPNYVPLLREAYKGWKNLEKVSKKQLFYQTGILYSGLPEDFLITGSLDSADKYNLEIEKLSPSLQAERYGQFNLPSHYSTILEPNAGFVTPEKGILAYVEAAFKAGATIHTHEVVQTWKEVDDSVEVITNKRKYTTGRLIITTGGWTGQLLSAHKPKLKVTSQAIFWVNVNNSHRYIIDKMPCWGINQEDLDGLFYGFPILNKNDFGHPGGLKIGYHYPGEITDPDEKNRPISPADKDIIINFMAKFMPGAFQSFNAAKTCLYTYSPDGHFIIDYLPEHQNVIFATGFSGHGFKFTPVIGRALADLALQGSTELPIDFLSLSRLL